MDISGIASQQAMTQLGFATKMVKSAQQSQEAVVEMVSQSVDTQRGKNLDVSV